MIELPPNLQINCESLYYVSPQDQDDRKTLLSHQNPMYISMHFLVDSKCFSAEPTENFRITYDKI